MLNHGLNNIWPHMKNVCGGVVRAYVDYTTTTYSEFEALIFPGYSTASVQALLGIIEEADYICVVRADYSPYRATKYMSLSIENHVNRYLIKTWRDVIDGYSIVSLQKTKGDSVV